MEEFEQQVRILESARLEIEDRILVRRVALDRRFINASFKGFLRSFESTESIQRKISNSVKRVEGMKNLRTDILHRIHLKNQVLSLYKSIERPKQSTILEISSTKSSELTNEVYSMSIRIQGIRISHLGNLSLLYPIELQSKNHGTIRAIPLPTMPGLKRVEKRDEESISTALAFLVNRIVLASKILDVPLRSVLVPFGSRSLIQDKFSNPSLRHSPLFFKNNGERLKYLNGVQMLHELLSQFAHVNDSSSANSSDLLELADFAFAQDSSRVSNK